MYVGQDTLHALPFQGSFTQEIMNLNRFKNETEKVFCESRHSLLMLENVKNS